MGAKTRRLSASSTSPVPLGAGSRPSSTVPLLCVAPEFRRQSLTVANILGGSVFRPSATHQRNTALVEMVYRRAIADSGVPLSRASVRIARFSFFAGDPSREPPVQLPSALSRPE